LRTHGPFSYTPAVASRFPTERVSLRHPSFLLSGAFAALLIASSGCAYDPPAHIEDSNAVIPERISFSLHVRPILSDRCFACHGPDAEGRVTDLRFDTEEGMRATLTNSQRNRAIISGNPNRSEMVHRILSDDPLTRMPPPESNLSLTAEEQAILIRWIEQGAEFEEHWAFSPPEKDTPPEITQTEWPRDDVDRFVLSRMEREGMSPASEASKEEWIRRVSFDLIGLPPTVAELDDFLLDTSSGAYGRVVDRLLSSEHYGERMAVDWLDLARYADSHGYQDDGWRNMWPWRDWVVRSFNANQPYDDFVTQQLAGDLFETPTKDDLLATGFNRNHLQSQEGGIVLEEFRVDYVANRTDTFGKAFLGVTMECGRCHDHRYDPVSMTEYYELFAFFNSVNEIGNIPYAGEASPTVILTTEVEDEELERIRTKIRELEHEANPSNPRWDAEVEPVAPDGPVAVEGMTAHYPIESFVEKDNLLTLEDRVQPDSAGYFWGDRERLPEIVEGVDGKAMKLVGDGWLDAGSKRHHFERYDPFTLSVWFRIENETTWGPLMAKTSGLFDGDRGYHTFLNPDHTISARLVHVGPDNEIRIRTTEPVPSGEWQHLVFRYDGSSRADGMELVLNGQPMPTRILTDNLHQSIRLSIHPFTGDSTNWAGPGDLRLGFTDNNLRMLDEVAFDEWKVFDRRLSLPEIRTLAGLGAGKEEWRDYILTTRSDAWKDVSQALRAARAQENRILTLAPETMIMRDLPDPRPTYTLHRGQYDDPRDPVTHGTPEAILAFPDSLPKNRLGLARWLFLDENPLTARVQVNRLWQHVFGRGLVVTSDNMGAQGALPSHPALLDWLAVEYRDSGWDTKALLRRLVLSATYRQTSRPTPELLESDPDNELLARGPARRLSAEQMRDHALAASGLLVPEIGGPPVRPYQPAGLWKEQATRNGTEYVQDSGDDLYRRSLYTIWKRTTPPPSMMIFDTSERNLCVVRRQSTSTPLQALVLMNDPQFVEASRLLAERMLREGGATDEERITWGFRALTARSPSEIERDALFELLEQERRSLSATAARQLLSAGEHPRDPSLPPREVAALTTVASTILNHDATITLR